MVNVGEIAPFEMNSFQDTPEKILGTWLQIWSLNLATDPTWAAPATLDVVGILLTRHVGLLSNKWRYLRADVEIKVALQSSPLDFGSIIITDYPGSAPNNGDLVNARPYVMDVSEGGTHTRLIKFSSYAHGYDLMDGILPVARKLPKPLVSIFCSNVSTMASAISSIYHVYARFVSPRLFGASPYAVAQMFNMQTVLETANVAQSTLNTLDRYHKIYQTIQGPAEAVRDALSTRATNTWSTLTGMFYDSEDKKEAEAADHAIPNKPTLFPGLCSMDYSPMENLGFSTKRIAAPNLGEKQQLHKMRMVAQIPCLVGTFDFVAETLKSLPTHPMKIVTVFGRGNYFSQMAQLFRFWRGSIDYKLIFHTSKMINARFKLLFQNNQGFTSVPASSEMFLPFREFEVSGCTEVNVRVPFIFSGDWVPMGIDSVFVDYFSTAALTIKCTEISSGLAGAAAVPHVFCDVVVSAGPDVQFKVLSAPRAKRPAVFKEPYDTPLAESQCFVFDKKDNEYDNVIHGASCETLLRPCVEDEIALEHLLMRWSERETNSTTLHPVTWVANPYVAHPDIFDFVLSMFRYFRGNIQHRLYVPAAIATGYFAVSMDPDPGTATSWNDYSIGQGSIATNVAVNPVLDFELPVESIYDWVPTPGSSGAYTPEGVLTATFTTEATNPSSYYVRGGRGFQVCYLNPPLDYSTYFRV